MSTLSVRDGQATVIEPGYEVPVRLEGGMPPCCVCPSVSLSKRTVIAFEHLRGLFVSMSVPVDGDSTYMTGQELSTHITLLSVSIPTGQ